MNSNPPAWALILAHCLISPIEWERTHDGEFPFEATVDGQRWAMRVNDFPAEPLYTLMIEDQAVLNLEDWPTVWSKR